MATKVEKNKILMVFHTDTDDQLVTTMGAVDDGIYGNPNKFTNVVISKDTFEAQKGALSTAVVASKGGGRNAVAEKNKQRSASTKMLSKLARYVEEIANNDLPTLTLSGFTVTSGKQPPKPLGPTGVDKLVQKVSGQIIVSPTPTSGARMMEIRYGAILPGATVPASFATVQVAKARPGTPINGLTPGTVYSFQVRAFGATGWTEWSDAVTKMST